MNDFFKKLTCSLLKHSEIGENGCVSGCILWCGTSDCYGYGVKRVKWPDGIQKLEKAHRVAYMAHHKLCSLPQLDETGLQLDVSHLCHTKLCINPAHLVLETHTSNMSRNHCRAARVCSLEHSPSCLF